MRFALAGVSGNAVAVENEHKLAVAHGSVAAQHIGKALACKRERGRGKLLVLRRAENEVIAVHYDVLAL